MMCHGLGLLITKLSLLFILFCRLVLQNMCYVLSVIQTTTADSRKQITTTNDDNFYFHKINTNLFVVDSFEIIN